MEERGIFGWEESQLATISAVEVVQTSWPEKLQIWPEGRLPGSCDSTHKQTGQVLLLLHLQVKSRPLLAEAHICTLPCKERAQGASSPLASQSVEFTSLDYPQLTEARTLSLESLTCRIGYPEACVLPMLILQDASHTTQTENLRHTGLHRVLNATDPT